MNRRTELAGKVALVTGGAGGIGGSIAGVFAEHGARVLVSDRADTGHEVANKIGGDFLKADLSSMEEVRALGERLDEAGHEVDILVNNAGTQFVAPIEEFPDETWVKMVQVMLVAPFHLIKITLPGMKERGWGRVINIASDLGLVASPYKSAYVSAKHGLVGLTKAIALEAGGYGVTVNAICPAYVRTPMVENQIEDQARMRGISVDSVVEKVMLGPAAIKRMIEPEEVARLALFLASEDSRSTTGAAYSMDLGWTAQ
jgi:3-hydroxybutyrate dehydrogenase